MQPRSPASIKVGDRVRRLRESASLTRNDLAALAQLDPSYLAKVEAGVANPTLQKLLQLAVALDLPLVELVKEIDKRDLPVDTQVVSYAQAARHIREHGVAG